MNITVYLGAGDIDNAHLKDAVRELGLWIAQSGNTLVYGGSKTGLMGVLANAVLDAGGKVVGVEAQFFMDAGVEHKALTELVVVKDKSKQRQMTRQLRLTPRTAPRRGRRRLPLQKSKTRSAQ